MCLATGLHLALLLLPLWLLGSLAAVADPAVAVVMGLRLAFGVMEGAAPRPAGAELPATIAGPPW